MPFVSDTFTDTNGTLLASHTGETGASWTLMSGAAEAEIQSNELQCQSTTQAEYYASGVPATNEYDVELDIVSVDTNSAAGTGVIGRVETGGQQDYYLADYIGNGASTPIWRLFKRINGSFTSLGSYSQDFTGTKTIKLEILDATKKVYVDGVERISSSDNVITAAGRAGLRMDVFSSGEFGDINGDNFTATDAGGGGGATIPIFAHHYRTLARS